MPDDRDILIIDDDPQLAFGVSRRLQSAGYATRIATDGEQGVLEADRQQPGVILMDMLMPNVDGLEALTLLRTDRKTRDVPVIMLSASLGDEQKALDAGARFFLRKPCRHDQLFAAVEQAFGASPTRRDGTYAAAPT